MKVSHIRYMKKIIIPLVVTLGLAASASAQAILDYTVDATPFPASGLIPVPADSPLLLVIPSFDTGLGTLLSVEIFLSGRQTATVAVENNTNQVVQSTASVAGSVTVRPDFNSNNQADEALSTAVVVLVDYTSLPVTLQPSDNGGVANGSGPDFYEFTDIDTGYINDSKLFNTNLSFYEGDGVSTWTALATATGVWGATGSGNSVTTVSNAAGYALVSAKYTYQVPEPTSALLALMPLAGLALRRRR
jgi:hypothetical protein